MARRNFVPTISGEYWIYALAAIVTTLFGSLLYVIDVPFKFQHRLG
jgi:hypothetical protein